MFSTTGVEGKESKHRYFAFPGKIHSSTTRQLLTLSRNGLACRCSSFASVENRPRVQFSGSRFRDTVLDLCWKKYGRVFSENDVEAEQSACSSFRKKWHFFLKTE